MLREELELVGGIFSQMLKADSTDAKIKLLRSLLAFYVKLDSLS